VAFIKFCVGFSMFLSSRCWFYCWFLLPYSCFWSLYFRPRLLWKI